ncbi:MAG TPA: hypothetical protein PKI49_13760 [Pseudomonadota bacterium]|jgi:hypothetical protein|nr:hypothetical protein [Pseudomonadota bacterium]HNF97947.1 hypothetical protein [Pseudomonadota bacterium]HNK46621.1 hypothetical protein [Pseudomonadota bacterium]HNN54251.1 hypothetical protein [Pseudomonadota bacterium]HNO69575.1 hypothetical protein [Pseudomonadota bacterium]
MESQIYRIVVFVESRLTPFAVCRLIMLSGVSVRKYGRVSIDDPQDLRKVRAALRALLNPRELGEIDALLAR